MNSRTRKIEVRGWIAIGFAFFALFIPMALTYLGFTDYDRDNGDPLSPSDHGTLERICLVSEWMLPACIMVWSASQIRVQNPVLFEDETQRCLIVPLTMGAAGVFLFAGRWLQWGPYTGEHFAFFEGWQFGLAWFLLWWCLVFVGMPNRASGAKYPLTESSPKRR